VAGPGKRRDFDRLKPGARRAALIEATLRCLKREGRDGLSARRIGAEAGISIGLINHYFPSKDDLVAAAYETLADRQLAMLRESAEAGGDPVARLRAFVAAFFGPDILDREVLRAWIVFWAMAFESEAVRGVHESSSGRFLQALGHLLAAARTDLADPASEATELSALLDGLWVEWCLADAPFAAAEGRAICDRWIDRFLAAPIPD
jgi:AcrR family transcriptional regulator